MTTDAMTAVLAEPVEINVDLLFDSSHVEPLYGAVRIVAQDHQRTQIWAATQTIKNSCAALQIRCALDATGTTFGLMIWNWIVNCLAATTNTTSLNFWLSLWSSNRQCTGQRSGHFIENNINWLK